MSEELRTTQSRNGSLQAALDKAEKDSNALSGQQMRGKVLMVAKCFGILMFRNMGPVVISQHLKHGISCVCAVF